MEGGGAEKTREVSLVPSPKSLRADERRATAKRGRPRKRVTIQEGSQIQVQPETREPPQGVEVPPDMARIPLTFEAKTS